MNQKKNKSHHLNEFQLRKNIIKILYFCLIIIIFYFHNETLKASEQEKDSISAKENSTIWYIHKSETAPIIFISTKGQIQKDDYLSFMLDSNNCDEVALTFQITSVMESIPQSDDISDSFNSLYIV